MNANVADVVIGAVYGDEGKGLMTDYLAGKHIENGKKVAVVRFNGGAQAGHTVVRNGIRHVFQHFGSGTLAGADTILSRHFIINPIAFFRELSELNAKVSGGIKGTIYVENECMVTTPFDIFINQALEQKRGDARHGSCGMGIGVTVGRYEENNYNIDLRAWEIGTPFLIKGKLLNIRKWFIAECEHLELTDNPHYPILLEDGIIDQFMRDCQDMCDVVRIGSVITGLYEEHDRLIFEGAQGLGLDQLFGTFPHVTRSFTGLRNVVDLMQTYLNRMEFNVHYMTRSYATRHGAGPLCGEVAEPFPEVVDETNVPNEFQGTMRFGYINLDELNKRIHEDLFSAKVVSIGKAKIHPTINISCMDQLKSNVFFIRDGERRSVNAGMLPREIEHATKVRVGYLSYGPSAETMEIMAHG